jgi:hypothetical protein
MNKPMTNDDLIALGYSREWVALANRIARRMQLKAAHQVVIEARKAGAVK